MRESHDQAPPDAQAAARIWRRRALLASAVLLSLWALVIAITGGFLVELGGLRVSSRHARNPLLLAILALACAAALSTSAKRAGLIRTLRECWTSIAGAATPVLRSIDLAALVAVAGSIVAISTWWSGRPFWLDEEMIALNIRDRTFAELIGPLSLEQRAPFGWLAFERVSGLLFGFTERGLRLVPVVFAVATLFAARDLGRRWMGAIGAALLVALCAFGPWTFHYSLELKHYSADMFFGLLLPALAVWTTDGSDASSRLKRGAVWWATAAIGQWFANSALFVAPACAVAVFVWIWRANGRRTALLFAACGAGWLACFAFYYAVTLRFTAGSAYMRDYWSFAFPPAGSGVSATIGWLVQQAAPFANKPAGTIYVVPFWVLAVVGFVVARRPLLGLVLASVPLSMALLGGLRLVPLYERLSIWALPALYAGVALAVDTGLRWMREALTVRQLSAVVGGLALVAGATPICVDIFQRARMESVAYPPDSNHSLNDRAGVTWLMDQHRRGDAVVTTKLALPAVWWYGGGSVAPDADGALLSSGTRVLEVSHEDDGDCDPEAFARALEPYDRALVFLGFRFDDVPKDFDEMLLGELARFGVVTEPRTFTGATRAVIVDLKPGDDRPADEDAATETAYDGCLHIADAVRW